VFLRFRLVRDRGELLPDRVEHAVHELRGGVAAVAAGDLDGFVDDDGRGEEGLLEHLEDGHPEDVPVDGGHPGDAPVDRDVLDEPVDLLAAGAHAPDEPGGIVQLLPARGRSRGLPGEGGLGPGVVELDLVKDAERALARRPALSHGGLTASRP